MDKTAVIAAIMALSQGEFAPCNFAVMATYDNGAPIASLNETRKMNPASNMKIITTGAALESLGPDYRWETVIGYNGEIDYAGTLHGNLYIIGSGDPMLGSDDAAAMPLSEEFAAWKTMLQDAGISRIDGSVVGDGRWLDGEIQEPSWWYSDFGFFYGTRLSGLNFYENAISVHVTPGAKDGEPLKLSAVYPQTPWMQWTYDCTTGENGTGDKLFYYSDFGSTKGRFTGTYAADKPSKTLGFRNNYPEYTLANEFCNYLSASGIQVSHGAAMIRDGGIAVTPAEVVFLDEPEINILGSTQSPTLLEVVRETNKVSNNLYAELLFRTMGKQLCSSCSIAASKQALEKVLTDVIGVGADPREIVICDGSGMSNVNLYSPQYMCRYLCTMTAMPHFGELFASMTTMLDGRVRYKTGSITGVRTLCGYVVPKDGMFPDGSGNAIVFSIMVGNSELPTKQIDALEKNIIRLLAE